MGPIVQADAEYLSGFRGWRTKIAGNECLGRCGSECRNDFPQFIPARKQVHGLVTERPIGCAFDVDGTSTTR
jgi:hypothetical protein